MILDLNEAGFGNKQTYLPSMEQLSEELHERIQDLFRECWGEPERTGARDWRAKKDDALSMVMHGPKRGAWFNHKGAGGWPLAFFATYVLGWDGIPRDNDGRRALRAKAASWLGIDVSKPVSDAEQARRRAEAALKAAQRAKSVQADEGGGAPQESRCGGRCAGCCAPHRGNPCRGLPARPGH